MKHLFPGFLTSEVEYASARQCWTDVWSQISASDRSTRGWKAGWFPPQPPHDGNPIFSAVSKREKKGIRIIQYEATAQEVELDFWIDTYGGRPSDPNAIRELVIACSLSTESLQIARTLMASWIVGEIEATPQQFAAVKQAAG